MFRRSSSRNSKEGPRGDCREMEASLIGEDLRGEYIDAGLPKRIWRYHGHAARSERTNIVVACQWPLDTLRELPQEADIR